MQRSLNVASIAFTAVLVHAACGTTVDSNVFGGGQGGAASTSTTSSASASASTTTTGDGAGGNPCWPDSCSAPSSSGVGASGGSAGRCGGVTSAPCPPDSFCDFASDQCGGTDRSGLCTPRPLGCDLEYIPTCGCDGTVYGNPCEANTSGVDVSNLGGCYAPPGMFPCGWTFCAFNEYCVRALSDVGGYPD